jgi:hypothetical protein
VLEEHGGCPYVFLRVFDPQLGIGIVEGKLRQDNACKQHVHMPAVRDHQQHKNNRRLVQPRLQATYGFNMGHSLLLPAA